MWDVLNLWKKVIFLPFAFFLFRLCGGVKAGKEEEDLLNQVMGIGVCRAAPGFA